MRSLHPRIAGQLQYVYTHGAPQWMTTGRTSLVVKDPAKGPIPSHYLFTYSLETFVQYISWRFVLSFVKGGLNAS